MKPGQLYGKTYSLAIIIKFSVGSIRKIRSYKLQFHFVGFSQG